MPTDRQGRLPTPLSPTAVESRVLTVRGENVLLDADLASIYGVSTKAFNQAVRRNVDRFPPDFRFRLTKTERDKVVTDCDHLRRLRFSPVLPWAFTEHGAVMAASVLSSPRAVEMSVFVVRAFVRLRRLAVTHAELAARLAELERRVGAHDKHLKAIIQAIRQLAPPPDEAPQRRIGFRGAEERN
ncbi:MAG: ORF6N domain-containing protein [Gemmatimonadetes bacterium]|nr:ORF6N domain-containing protein [Gemmatimonadota bacterium]